MRDWSALIISSLKRMSLIYKEDGDPKIAQIIIAILAFLFTWVVVWAVIGPEYRVWSAKKQGEAEYAQAEQNRRIQTLEAQALKESATLKAEAEIERAKGVAQANAIIADSLKGNESYLRYLWIDKLSDNQNVIYVPTEAGLPILEAGKRQ